MDVEQHRNGTVSSLNARVGTTLENRYLIHEVLAEGGMGVVYKGERVGLKRPVAVKFLHASFAADAKVRERFERELHAMSRLTHPNCISVVDYGIADSPFIVMEYVTGRTLRHVLSEEGRLSPIRALFIASQILAALAHAHSQDMIHRDIKPGNIILSDIEGTLDHVYVLDFGLAKFLSSAATDDLTASGMLLGTPSYMSPEQARAQAIGAATDIYSTGVVLFELLTGTKPYTGQNALDILHLHQFAPVPSIRERLPEARFSRQLDKAIQTALAKDPAKRFLSATAFSRALDQVPEAGAIRTSTKLRALSPPPGYDEGESEAASAAAAPADAQVMDLLETINGPAAAAVVALPSIRPQSLAGMAAQGPAWGSPDMPSITSSSTLSTLVPGALQPRATGHVPAVERREDTPLAIAVGHLSRLGTSTVRIALAAVVLAVAGLATWYAASDDDEPVEQAAASEPGPLVHSALAVAGPPSPGQPEKLDGQTGAAAPEAAAEPEVAGEPEAAGALEIAEAAAEPEAAGEPEAAEPGADPEAEIAATDPAAAVEPAAPAQPARPERASVDGIDDIDRLLLQGRRDEAMQGIIRLRRTNFTRSGYLAFQLGNLYFDKMQWRNGLEAYEDALRLKPEYRGNATLNANVIRSLSHNLTWRKATALYTDRIRQAGAKYLREASASDKSPVVRQRAKQILGRIGGKR